MRNNFNGIRINTSKNTHEKVYDLINKDIRSTVMDIPSGNGAFVQRLKDAGITNIIAIDIENMLEIEHKDFVKEIYRILNNKGGIIISTPNISSLRS